ncbi:MAG: ABC transporter permease [Acidimicrobiales bacterium]
MVTSRAGRVIAVTAVASVVTLGSVAIGGVPLLFGLLVMVVAGMMLLPFGPRRYLLRRTVRVLTTIFVAMAIVWLLVHNYPDASRDSPTGVIPAMERYIVWISDLLFGEFGDSTYSETVGEGLSRTIPISTQLVVYSQVVAVLIAVPGAIAGARFRGRSIDLGFRALTLLGLALPIFVIGPIFQYALGVGDIDMLGMSWGWQVFPVGRYIPFGDGPVEHFQSMALPSITLGVTTAAVYMVLLRSEIIQQLPSEHVLLARSKGVPPGRIIRVHALRPASPSVVAAIGAQSSLLFGHMLIIERIFILPGFGDYVLVAIGRRDDLAVVGALFVTAAILALVNLFADALLLAIDPRLET